MVIGHWSKKEVLQEKCCKNLSVVYNKVITHRKGLFMATKRIMITLSEKAMAELERLAEEKGMSKSVLIALALEEYAKKGVVHEGK